MTSTVTDLQAELAGLPAAIEHATTEGDTALLAELLVRDRVLERQILEAGRQVKRDRLDAIGEELERLSDGFDGEAELHSLYLAASKAYEVAANEIRSRLHPRNQRINRLLAERVALLAEL